MVTGESVNKKFWKDKCVLLTGHTGFKGSWLSIWLKDLGVKLVGYSLQPPTEPSLFEIANIKEGIVSIHGDIRDLENLKKTIEKYKPEIIIHMAAQSLVLKSYENPCETFETNVLGTVNVLEAVRQIGGVKVIINVTSDKCYENKETAVAYKEEDSLGGRDPYSASKACAEHITSAYKNSFSLNVVSVRAGNVIGGGDWAPDRLIPDIVRANFDSKILKIRNPDAIRPWQHVLEPLSAYMILTERLWYEGEKYSEAWNFGPNDSDVKSVLWICEHFIDLWEDKIKLEIDKGTKPLEAKLLKLDISKARNKLNWQPRWNIEQALEKTADWYKAYKEKKDMREFSLTQIEEYTNTLSSKLLSVPFTAGDAGRVGSRTRNL